MRSGYLFAAVVLIGAAIWFAPRAGRPPPTPEFVPDRPTDEPPPPQAPTKPPRSPDERPPGFCDLQKVYALLPRDEYSWIFPDAAARQIREYQKLEWRWVKPEIFEYASRLLLETHEHSRRLNAEQTYRDAWRIHTNVRLHPIFRDMTFVVEGRPPWVLYVDQGPRAETYSARAIEWLEQLSMAFRAEFDLPPITKAEWEVERVLKVMVFRDRDAFHEYHTKINRPRWRNTLSVYSSEDRWSFTYREKGRSPTEEARRLLHPAVYQLLHFHTKLAIQRAGPAGEEVSFANRHVHSQPTWFREGLVRAFSTVRMEKDGRLAFLRVDPECLEPWRESREEDQPQWDFAEILRIPNGAALQRRATEITGHPIEASRLMLRFIDQATALIWFFRETEDVGIRENFRRYVALALKGKGQYEDFRKVFGKEDDDWSALEKKFEAWLATTWKKK